MDKKFTKLLEKLRLEEPSDYVKDNYSSDDMIEEIASKSEQLTPEDVRKIHFLESTEGERLSNPESSAKGNFHILDGTRSDLLKKIKEEIPVHPERQDALLMSENIKDIEKVLKNSSKGPFKPNLENIYAGHHYGKQGMLNMFSDPENPLNQERLSNIRNLLSKKLPKKEKVVKPAKDLLDLLEE